MVTFSENANLSETQFYLYELFSLLLETCQNDITVSILIYNGEGLSNVCVCVCVCVYAYILFAFKEKRSLWSRYKPKRWPRKTFTTGSVDYAVQNRLNLSCPWQPRPAAASAATLPPAWATLRPPGKEVWLEPNWCLWSFLSLPLFIDWFIDVL